MAGFLYFIPGLKNEVVNEHAGKLVPSCIEQHGLSHVFENRMVAPDQTAYHFGPGPNDVVGVLLYPRSSRGDLPKCFYSPLEQAWHKFRSIWIGWETALGTPGPQDLARDTQIPGLGIEDQQGREWSVPAIRPGNCTLPREFQYDSDGQFQLSIRDQDKPLWDLSGEAINYLSGCAQLDDEAVAEMVLRFLQANYHIGKPELFALARAGANVIDTQFAAMVFGVVTNFSILDEYQKKS